MGSQQQLEVLVIGAGIGGLTAALALRRAGHKVSIYERSAMLRELGQGIVVSPSAGRVLQRYGFDFNRAKLVANQGRAYLDAKTLVPIGENQVFTDVQVRDETPTYTAHRVDLHGELLRLAIGEDGIGTPSTLYRESTVTSFDPEAGTVTLADGNVARGDLVIAADGLHSSASSVIMAPQSSPPVQPSDLLVYRFVIATEKIHSDPDLAPALMIGKDRVHFAISAARDMWLLWYHCRAREVCNFGIYTTRPPLVKEGSGGGAGLLRAQIDREALKKELAEFHPAIINVLDHAHEVLPMWQCATREPLSKFHRGRLVIIGDAAHPILPNLGMGANSAIEDAGALGALFESSGLVSSSSEEIQKRLATFSDVRVPRVAVYKLYSDIAMFDETVERQRSKAERWMKTEDLPATHEGILPWVSAYNVFQAVQQAHL